MVPISTATNTAGAPIPVGGSPVAIAVTPDGRTAYVASRTPGTVTAISTATNAVVGALSVGALLDSIAITPDGKTAYVADAAGVLIPVSTATNTAGPPIPAGNRPVAVAIAP